MLLELSKSELLALESLCQADGLSAGLLAEKLGAKPPAVSRLVRSLTEKGFLYSERQGATKHLRLSPASHAQAFKRLFQSRPKASVESWLSGCALDVLVVLGSKGADLHRLEKECSCSKATIFRMLKSLRGAGVASKNASGYQITDERVLAFAKDFADNLQLVLQKQLKGYTVGLRMGKHVLVRTETLTVPDYFSITGMNALRSMGLEIIPTSYHDYYFNLDCMKKKIAAETQFIHALVLASLPQHAADKTALAIFVKQNRNLDNGKLKKLAEEYGVSSLLQELRTAVGYYEKIRGYE